MLRYITKRLLMIIPIVLAIIFVLFVMLYMLPGSRIRQMPIYRGGDVLDSVFKAIGAQDGMFTKYIRYCFNVFFHFDFGRSESTRLGLIRELGMRLRTTMLILTCGVGATLIVGIPAGVYTAVRKNRFADRAINVVTLFFSSIPSYALAIAVTLVIAVYLRLVPVVGSYNSPETYFMPTLTIVLGGSSAIARMTRASMLEVLEQPFITALRAKGLGEGRIICTHALKNALVSVVSSLGGFIAQLLCGTLVVEFFFGVLGLGSYMLRSTGSRDHLEVLCCTVVLTIILTVTNVIADVLYMLLNPRIKLRYTSRRRRGTAR